MSPSIDSTLPAFPMSDNDLDHLSRLALRATTTEAAVGLFGSLRLRASHYGDNHELACLSKRWLEYLEENDRGESVTDVLWATPIGKMVEANEAMGVIQEGWHRVMAAAVSMAKMYRSKPKKWGHLWAGSVFGPATMAEAFTLIGLAARHERIRRESK